MSLVIYLFIAMSLIILLISTLPRRSRFPGIPRVGKTSGLLDINRAAAKREFMNNGHRLVDAGYRKYRDKPFIVQTEDMERLILPPKFLAELRMLPETKLNQSIALVERWLGHYSGVDIVLKSRHHSHVCRVQLTQNLPEFVPDMAAELSFAMSRSLIHCSSREYASIPTYSYVYSMILAVSSRVFVGLPLSREKAWLDNVSAYLNEVAAIADSLRPYPRLLRPLLRPFLAPKSRMDGILSKALEILGPAIQERQKPHHKANDLLGFLISTSKVVNPKEITLKLLVLNAAALHTSTMVAVHTLYDLCERPSYIVDLRAEIKDVLKEEGSWRISTINKLRKLDSFMKESMRYNQPNALSFDRIVLTPHTLSTGLHLPIGTFISMASESMSRDPTYYSSPDSPTIFNPSRFHQSFARTEKPIYNPLKEFTSIEPGNLAWGNGRQTCPGRWYAGVVIKLVVGTLLEGYEMKFPEGVRRPENLYRNAGTMPCVKQEILLRELV
ncbi:523ff31b-83c7-4f83-86e0-be06ec8d3804 [Sclerotinia trifoliorum]|uniref:523ff31b-83c7-4f83-86e0-be06ec8d3804 n=1 Tax=Sclerotinia trifoliorum TaxID=28548 RepID=A0A8H2ZS95_9HELO|nr:523ff31b-83c7-4f83-86e0-be06ec8d3804 [Sclerotinia trifoliorum]